jgi:hypothetical protein
MPQRRCHVESGIKKSPHLSRITLWCAALALITPWGRLVEDVRGLKLYKKKEGDCVTQARFAKLGCLCALRQVL